MSERYPNRWRERSRGGRARGDYKDNRRREFDRSYSTYSSARGSRDATTENTTNYRHDNWDGKQDYNLNRERGVSSYNDKRPWRSLNNSRPDYRDRNERHEEGEARQPSRPYISQQKSSYPRYGGYNRPSFGPRGPKSLSGNYRRNSQKRNTDGNNAHESHWVTRLNLTGKIRKDVASLFERLESVNKSLREESIKRVIAETEVEKYNRLMQSENLKCQLIEERLETLDLA